MFIILKHDLTQINVTSILAILFWPHKFTMTSHWNIVTSPPPLPGPLCLTRKRAGVKLRNNMRKMSCSYNFGKGKGKLLLRGRGVIVFISPLETFAIPWVIFMQKTLMSGLIRIGKNFAKGTMILTDLKKSMLRARTISFAEIEKIFNPNSLECKCQKNVYLL